MKIDMSKPNDIMKEYEVQIYLTYEDESEDTYGCIDELHVFDKLEEAEDCYYDVAVFLHKQLMHYPDYDKSEDGGDGDILFEE